MSLDDDQKNLVMAELQQIAWDQLGVRVPSFARREEVHKLLHYEIKENEIEVAIEPNINQMRDTLIAFITKYKNQLSLPCNGDCYQHVDGVVLNCYLQYLEDNPECQD